MADTGATQVTAASTGGAQPLIWRPTYGSAEGLPAAVTGAGTSGWKYGTGTSTSMPTAPSWPTVVAGQAGSVSAPGDLAMIDATDTRTMYLLVRVDVTNLWPLSLTYNSYSLPVRIYAATNFVRGSIAWSANPVTDASGNDTANTYLTNTLGYETFKLATGPNKYYEITLDSGGAFYAFQTGATGAATTPSFYTTVQKTS